VIPVAHGGKEVEVEDDVVAETDALNALLPALFFARTA
jgi:hypothetical protein